MLFFELVNKQLRTHGTAQATVRALMRCFPYGIPNVIQEF